MFGAPSFYAKSLSRGLSEEYEKRAARMLNEAFESTFPDAWTAAYRAALAVAKLQRPPPWR